MPARFLAALFAPPTKYAAATGAILSAVVGVERWWFVPGVLLLALLFFQLVEFTTYALLSFRQRQVRAWQMRHHLREGDTEGKGSESFGTPVRSADSVEHYREMTFRVGSKVMTWALWACALGLDGILHAAPEVFPAIDFPLLSRNEFLPLSITATVMLVVMEIGRIADNAARYQGAGGDAWIIRKMLGLFPWMLPRLPKEEEAPLPSPARRRRPPRVPP